MPLNLIIIATPPFKAFGFMHDKSNEYYKFDVSNEHLR